MVDRTKTQGELDEWYTRLRLYELRIVEYEHDYRLKASDVANFSLVMFALSVMLPLSTLIVHVLARAGQESTVFWYCVLACLLHLANFAAYVRIVKRTTTKCTQIKNCVLHVYSMIKHLEMVRIPLESPPSLADLEDRFHSPGNDDIIFGLRNRALQENVEKLYITGAAYIAMWLITFLINIFTPLLQVQAQSGG